MTWGTDKIIAVGLMAAFVITVLAMDISAVLRGDMDLGAIAKELSIGLFAYLGRGLTHSEPSNSQQSRAAETLGKVETTAGEAKKIVEAIDAVKDTFKK